MTTSTIHYDEHNADLKKILELFVSLGGRIEKTYDTDFAPELVQKVKEGEAEYEAGKCKVLNTEDLWK